MKKKKKKNTRKHTDPKRPQRPSFFNDFVTCAKWLKRSVYLIVRGRKVNIDGQESVKWITLGSGFVAAPHRMITDAHVINDSQKGELMQHKEGDQYYLLQHDDDNNSHCCIVKPKLDSEIFLYPDFDLGIIYLDESFYKCGEKVFVDQNDFIRISSKILPIGSEIGVLGYPLCELAFEDRDFSKPKIGGILIRIDKGVVNCKYRTSETTSVYEFTLSFNPGNSGGPIFDVRTGEVISLVKGLKLIPIIQKEEPISEEKAKEFKIYKEKAYIETLYTTYSMGIAIPSFWEILKKHEIVN
ncbi:MAG: hypothetical protein K940chlam8_00470 [Chlamydiae bacterium]|nr:hypothetical protein [Chlamydiota bacterium]